MLGTYMIMSDHAPFPYFIFSVSFYIFMFVLQLFISIMVAFAIFMSFSLHTSIWKWLVLSPNYTFAFLSGIFLFLQILTSFYLEKKFRVVLVLLNFFNIFFSEKFFTFYSVLNNHLAGQSTIDSKFFPFSSLNISCYSLPFAKFLQKKEAESLVRVPL